MDNMNYVFPVNGVQRDQCSKCIFFEGRFDAQLRLTSCGFPVDAPMGSTFMTPYDIWEEKYHPEYIAKRQESCPCFIDKSDLINRCRNSVLNVLR